MSAGFSTGITSLRNVTMSGSCFSKMRRVNKWWLDLEIHVALPFFPKKLNKFKNGTRSILRSSFAGAPKKLRELRGQGHMQHGALMKLGLFGKQLCLSVFNYLPSMFRFVKNHSWLRILFHSFHWLFKCFLHELYRGRYWCFADLLLSLLWQRCKAWVAEGSHLPSRCRQWKRVYRKTKQS